MSLLDRLEHLQHSTVQRRKVVLVFAVTILMMGIIGLWVLQLRYEASSNTGRNTGEASPSPFRVIWESGRKGFEKQFKELYERR